MPHKTMNSKPNIFWYTVGVGILTLTYMLAAYFQAATASLKDSYQPGIEILRLFTMPGALLFAVFLAAFLVKSYTSARLSVIFCRAALCVCALLFIITVFPWSKSSGNWLFPEERTLSTTVKTALFQPSFSNRSSISAASSGAFAFILLAASTRLAKKRHNQSLKRTG